MARKPTLRDVEGNTEAIFVVMKASRGVGRFSSILLKEAILTFYTECELFPTGITSSMAVIDKWALRQGSALQRLVPWQLRGGDIQLVISFK